MAHEAAAPFPSCSGRHKLRHAKVITDHSEPPTTPYSGSKGPVCGKVVGVGMANECGGGHDPSNSKALRARRRGDYRA